jgi:2-iminobutanoate/2-iminopropanoate deaminase
MEIIEIKTDKAPNPVGPYSQAVVAGNLVFCSGQIAINPWTGTMISDDIESETSMVMENLKAILDESGSSFEDVVKTTIYLIDMSDFAKVNEIYGKYFTKVKPARSTVQVVKLPKGANVEIECIAMIKKA